MADSLERFAEELKMVGAGKSADTLLRTKTSFFDPAERAVPGITDTTIRGLESIFGSQMETEGIYRFPQALEQDLRNSGRRILTPTGKTISEIVKEGLDVRPMDVADEVRSDNEVFTQTSLRSQVAVYPDQYILKYSVGLPPEQQDETLATYKREIERAFPGATVIKGNAVTHIHLALMYFRLSGRDFDRNRPNWARVQTSSAWKHFDDSLALVSPLSLDRDNKLNIWVQPLDRRLFDYTHPITQGGSVRVGVAPLIVPIEAAEAI
jgi:hypothetical protein